MNSLEPSISTEVPASDIMLQMISGFWVSRAIHAAALLGIADCLKEEPKTPEELAAITNTHVPSLYRLLRALASVGIFAEDDHHRFGLTPLAATLQTDVPASMRFFAISELGQAHYLGWGNLLHSQDLRIDKKDSMCSRKKVDSGSLDHPQKTAQCPIIPKLCA